MSHEVFDTLNLIRDLQAQYAAFRAQQHFVTAPGMGCATTARLEAIDLERCRWEDVYRNVPWAPSFLRWKPSPQC